MDRGLLRLPASRRHGLHEPTGNWHRPVADISGATDKSDAADEYLKPLTPKTKRVVEWINAMLDSKDLNAWQKKPKKKSVKELP